MLNNKNKVSIFKNGVVSKSKRRELRLVQHSEDPKCLVIEMTHRCPKDKRHLPLSIETWRSKKDRTLSFAIDSERLDELIGTLVMYKEHVLNNNSPEVVVMKFDYEEESEEE